MTEAEIRALFATLFDAAIAPVLDRVSAIEVRLDTIEAIDPVDLSPLATRIETLEGYGIDNYGERLGAIVVNIGQIEAQLAQFSDPGEIILDPNSPDGVRVRWIDAVLPKYFGTDYPPVVAFVAPTEE